MGGAKLVRPVATAYALPSAGIAVDRMNADNMSAFCEHLFRLDSDALLDRFGSVVQPDFLSDYVERAPLLNAAIFSCVLDGAVRGVGELRRLGAGLEHDAEAALTVERPYAGCGIGTALMAALLSEAARTDISEIFSIFHARNQRMRRIVEKFDGAILVDGYNLIGYLRPSRFKSITSRN